MSMTLKQKAEQAVQLAAVLIVVGFIAFVALKFAIELKIHGNSWFTPPLSRVDRAIIAGCESTLKADQFPAEKAAHLVALHCEQYSDRQFAQLDRDLSKCFENAAKGDAVTDRCIDAARGY